MFSPETLQKFAREVTKYPAIQKQSAEMACLALALFRVVIMQVNISRKNSGLVMVRPQLTASSL